MFRFAIALALLSASHGVLAAPSAADAQPVATASPSAPPAKPATPADPDKLMPPLPPLTSLPPLSAQAAQGAQLAQEGDDDATATRGGRHAKKAPRGRSRTGKPAETVIRIVVSPESRAYLASVSTKLDAALQGTPRDARAASDAAVAMRR